MHHQIIIFSHTDHMYFTVCDGHMVATRTRSEKLFSNNKVYEFYYLIFSNKSINITSEGLWV